MLNFGDSAPMKYIHAWSHRNTILGAIEINHFMRLGAVKESL